MKGKKVLFIVPFPVNCAPSQRLKFEQYFDHFRRHGFEIEVSPFVSPQFRKIIYKKGFYLRKVFYTLQGYFRRIKDILRAKDYNIIYLHLEAGPFGPPVFEYLFYKVKRPIIYDIDDVIYLPHASSANNFVKFLRFPQKVPAIIKLSSEVIVVTEYLKLFAEHFNKNVTYIPPTIDTDKYCIKTSCADRKVCVGWTGSHSTSRYLMLLKDVLSCLSKKYDIKIRVFGDKNFKINGLDIEAKDWSADTEVEDIQSIDIGLYPLPNTEWVMGKGGLKALQYMGMGIPVVCTRIGAVTGFIKDGINGLLADSDEEWVRKTAQLIEDAELRKKVGLAGRATVEEHFSVKVNAPKYLEIFGRLR